ncbi:AraC family transcriptional regulator [Sedimentibacter sp. MB31-C6]|uniref:AraC family transcriptional regulator n=1 Tax=Sedimentibacter sp. MB31-C6 TaxID=3109366 RepID=UPI002DDD9C7E|nr:helix-turn-helix domain-containing protein [Sedimentibacter sp. MB36-C1]WSI03629.1 helix-turn-helix domain-containing protein [Sedimentibacter sp. MB36-C1]
MKEDIFFNENMPFFVKIQAIKRYPIHWHEDVTEILIPIKGTINVVANHERVLVKENDFIFINNNSFHSIQSKEEAIVASIHIDLNFFETKYEFIKYMYFRNNMYSKYYAKIESDNFDFSKKASKKMFMNKLIGVIIDTVSNNESLAKISYFYIEQIVESMVKDFNWLQFLKSDKIKKENLDRYYRIVRFIRDNINKKISLNDIISMEYISKNYFSHFWKDLCDFSFSERVNFEKVFESEFMLLTTDMNIASIAEELNFSDAKYYYNHFKKWYGCTPLMHRRRCFSYMKSDMEYYKLPNDRAAELIVDYINYHSLSSYEDLSRFSYDKYTIIERIFSLDIDFFSNENMSIVLDLFKYVRVENDNIKINWYIIFQTILISYAKNLDMTVKIDFTYTDEIDFLSVISEFFKFSLFHFDKSIINKWDYFIKYDESITTDYIKNIKTIIKSNVDKATFKYYFEI